MSRRSILVSAALVGGFPSDALAHGEQLLVYPGSTVLLLMVTAAAVGAWGKSLRHKSLTLMTLLVVHAALWFVPLTPAGLVSVIGWMFIALVTLPLGAAAAVQAIAKWRA